MNKNINSTPSFLRIQSDWIRNSLGSQNLCINSHSRLTNFNVLIFVHTPGASMSISRLVICIICSLPVSFLFSETRHPNKITILIEDLKVVPSFLYFVKEYNMGSCMLFVIHFSDWMLFKFHVLVCSQYLQYLWFNALKLLPPIDVHTQAFFQRAQLYISHYWNWSASPLSIGTNWSMLFCNHFLSWYHFMYLLTTLRCAYIS